MCVGNFYTLMLIYDWICHTKSESVIFKKNILTQFLSTKSPFEFVCEFPKVIEQSKKLVSYIRIKAFRYSKIIKSWFINIILKKRKLIKVNTTNDNNKILLFQPENIKHKLLHFDTIRCGGLNDVPLLIHVGDLLLSHVVLE